MTNLQARPRSLNQALAQRRSGGFTLIELMLVLMILAALAVLVVPRITGHGKEAKITTARLGINNIKSALQNFEMNCDRFPTTEEGLQALIQVPGNVPGWKGPYLDQQTIPVDPWQNPYQYRCPGQHNNDYDLYSYGPDGQDGGEDDINNWSLPTQRANGAASGFTLFELIMVLMLLAVLLGAAVPSMRGFARARADADAADSVLAMTRMARDLAATGGTVSRLNFDFKTGGYWVTVQKGGQFVDPGTSDSVPQILASDMGVKLDLPSGVEPRPYVQFMPDGRAEEATISLICRDGDVYRVSCPSATDTFRIIKPTEYQP